MMTGKAFMPSLPKRNMKPRVHWKFSFGLVLAVLPLAVGSAPEAFTQPTAPSPAADMAAAPEEAAEPVAALAPPSPAEATFDDELVDAPAKPISTAKPLPPAVRPTAPVAEVRKLADSGVDESVMLAFVAHSTSAFNLGAEEIIYLNDIGVPSAVVTAMIQRDQALNPSVANAGPAPASPAPLPAEMAPPAAEPAPAPAPADMAPQPDNMADSSAPPGDDPAAFYDSLAPYGTWVDVSGYGPCWQPTAVVLNAGWQPYCNGGRWVYTDCGWYWLSGYSWGWGPFHYGRWFRHKHYGWCWRPGSTWGPSWVCWRYTGSYCGWAPLPPAARYHPALGLTFHGQRVGGSFSFGLGVNSYTFVAASHFPDHHLNRYALPHQQATQIFHQTVPSTTIVAHGSRVVNQGIPVTHLAAASHRQFQAVGIREVNGPGPRGGRGEQLEPNSQTLSVFRPRLSQSSGTPAGDAGRPRSGLGRTGGSPAPGSAAMPAAPHPTPIQSPRATGSSPTSQPSSGGGSGRRPDRSVNSTKATLPTPSRPATYAQPLFVHGSDRSRDRSGAARLDHAAPPNSFIVRGNDRYTPSQPINEPSTKTVEVRPNRPVATAADTAWRPARTQQAAMPSVSRAGWQAPAQSQWSAPRAAEPRPHIHSPSTPSPASRVGPVVSQPAYPMPSPRAAPAPAAHFRSSSDKTGR